MADEPQTGKGGATTVGSGEAKARPVGALLTQARAAEWLGLSQSFLSRLGGRHPFYAPDTNGVPGIAGSGRHYRRYHRRHVELMEAVLAGGMEIGEASAEWAVTRARIGRKVEPQRGRQ